VEGTFDGFMESVGPGKAASTSAVMFNNDRLKCQQNDSMRTIINLNYLHETGGGL